MAMNAGAYGGEIKDIIVQVTVLTNEGNDSFFRKMSLNLAIVKVSLRKKDIMYYPQSLISQRRSRRNRCENGRSYVSTRIKATARISISG